MNTLDPTKPVATRQGCAVRILTWASGHPDRPIVGYIIRPSGMQQLMCWRVSGTAGGAINHADDLVNIKVKKEGWINIQPYTWGRPQLNRLNYAFGGMVFDTEAAAKAHGIHGSVQAKVEWEE